MVSVSGSFSVISWVMLCVCFCVVGGVVWFFICVSCCRVSRVVNVVSIVSVSVSGFWLSRNVVNGVNNVKLSRLWVLCRECSLLDLIVSIVVSSV